MANPLRLTRPAAAFLLLGLAACASPARRYVDQGMDFGAVRTVVVMPFQNLSRENLAAERVRDVFSNMLLASSSIYVVPLGEVQRAITQTGIQNPATPGTEEVVKLGKTLKADAVVTGVVKEYGEVRSGNAAGNVVSMSLQMFETATGKVVWSASTTQGGISMGDRLLGSSGAPMNQVTEAAVDDLLAKLFR
ncbi:MAG TPA: GNA1162 family protein [Anaeromyxobacteraceae bacterium]|nr:GNA1162 family protein [Anaeromyxobacteraceae bacterium]